MERFVATIRFSTNNRKEAEKVFEAFLPFVPDREPYQATLEGNVWMNLTTVNHEPEPKS